MIVVVTGTGTDVGKTWWAAAVITALRAGGKTAAARKPAQSFDAANTHPTDADVLASATAEDSLTVCPPHRWYPLAMAPPMAADALGLPSFTISDLVAELAPAPLADIMFVEGAGGPHSPIACDGDTTDLARGVAAEIVVLVSDAGLGSINAVRCSADALTGFPILVALNHFDETDRVHVANRLWLEQAGFEIFVTPAAIAARLSS